MGYSEDPSMVRVDFFKPNGKWYATETVKWLTYEGVDLHSAFAESLAKALNGRMSGMTAVCLEPYHVHAHPVMIVVGLKDW